MVSFDPFLKYVVASDLVSQRRLSSALQEFRATAEGSENDAPALLRFADWLVRQKILTAWQCANLLAGKHKGFRLGKYLLLDHLANGKAGSRYLALNAHSQERVEIIVSPPSRQTSYFVIEPGSLIDEDRD